MDSLPNLFKKLFPPEEVIKCAKTKSTEMVTKILAPYSRNYICNILKNRKFSLTIDESTDISVQECLVLMVRFLNETSSSVEDHFLGLLKLEESSSQDIFEKII